MSGACTYDVVIYIYNDSEPPPRGLRLPDCARRYALWRGLTAADFTVAAAGGGKPYFPQSPHIHFSISHSGAYWAAAFGGQPLGLDIQRHEARNHLALAKRWYHREEYAAVEQKGSACFFDIWSAKESLVKCSGEGVSPSFSAFSVLKNGVIAERCGPWQLKLLHLADGYSACLCAENLGQVHVEQGAL